MNCTHLANTMSFHQQMSLLTLDRVIANLVLLKKKKVRRIHPCQQRSSPERFEYKSSFRLEKVSEEELCGMRARYIRTVLQFELHGPAFSLQLKVSVLYKGPYLAKVVYLN